MNLDAPAIEDNLDTLTDEHILAWASQYLPDPSAEAFTDWIEPEISDYANHDITIRQVLTGAYQEWTGHEYPNP